MIAAAAFEAAFVIDVIIIQLVCFNLLPWLQHEQHEQLYNPSKAETILKFHSLTSELASQPASQVSSPERAKCLRGQETENNGGNKSFCSFWRVKCAVVVVVVVPVCLCVYVLCVVLCPSFVFFVRFNWYKRYTSTNGMSNPSYNIQPTLCCICTYHIPLIRGLSTKGGWIGKLSEWERQSLVLRQLSEREL